MSETILNLKGQWFREPDRDIARYKGYYYMVMRGPLGGLNGYVALPPKHLYHGKHYEQIGVPAHGGLTFSQDGDDRNWPMKEFYWIGFDTGHVGDIIPSFIMDRDGYKIPEDLKRMTIQLWKMEKATYKDFEFVELECLNMIDHLGPSWLKFPKPVSDLIVRGMMRRRQLEWDWWSLKLDLRKAWKKYVRALERLI